MTCGKTLLSCETSWHAQTLSGTTLNPMPIFDFLPQKIFLNPPVELLLQAPETTKV